MTGLHLPVSCFVLAVESLASAIGGRRSVHVIKRRNPD